MNWFHQILCWFAVIIFTSYCVNAEINENNNLNHGEEELIPPEQILDTHDAEISDRKSSAQFSNTQMRQTWAPYLNGWNFEPNNRFPFGHGLIANPLVGHRLDAQASSPSNNVVLVLANEKNKLAELAKPAEESLKRLVRNPDAVDDIVGQFNLFGGNMAQRMFQQVAQTAPELSRSFGQALSEVLAQTSALAQTPPGNFNLSQLPLGLGPVKPPENLDFGQLGQRLSQSFLLGAAPNLMKSQISENTKEAEPVTATEQTAEVAPSLTQQNPLVGHPLLPPLNFGLSPMGIFRPLRLFNPLMPLASEISEVRVKPDDYNPYKLTPKEVDHQTMAEMRLKALLRDALAKKTIPILWFHLPSSQNVHKSPEDLEIEAKLKIFEKQVITELEQLQELSKLANELKTTQLQSASKPTPSLTTKLNLSEIPVYEITLGDIEKTLEDEHVRMLMQTITQNQNKQLHRHHQATTQYLTDLTGNPIKRQTSTEDVLKTMEKDDLLNMMSYAYRMAAKNGQIPWLNSEEQTQSMAMEDEKQTKINNEGEPTDMSSQLLMQNPTNDHNMPIQRQSMMSNTEMATEKQWLEDKQRQMLVEAEQQRKINDEMRTGDVQQNKFSSQSVNLNMPAQSQSMMEKTEMTAEKQWLADKQRQMALEAGMQTTMNNEGKSIDMSSQMLMQNPTTPPHRPTETINQRQIPQQMPNGKPTDTHPNTFSRQWFDQNMLSQMFMQNPTTPPHRPPPQTIMERQIPQQMPNGKPTDTHPNTFARQWFDQNMLSQMLMQNPTTPPHRPPPQMIMERQLPQGMMIMQNPTTPPHRPPPQTIMERQIPEGMMIMQNPTTPPHRPPPQTLMERQTPQDMMIMQNPTTPPHRPPPQTIMERQIQQEMMTVQNPTTPPHRPPPQTIMERQLPQEMMSMQNPTTPPHRPPPETIIERQIPQHMANGKPTDTHPNTFARQWFDQNMFSQMLMQNPTTPPHRPPPQTIMERQIPQEMMTVQNPTTPPHRPPPQTIMERQIPLEMLTVQNPTTPPHRPPPQMIMERQVPQEMMNAQNPTTPPHRPPPQTIMERQIPQEMMTVQNPTTPPHRPPPQTIMERQVPQEMMIAQNPTTPPHRPPPQTIMERQVPQEMVNAQNPTTPPHRPPPQTIMERQIPQQMPNGKPTDTHPNTFARQWFDQNMLSQMLMQNPTTPPHRPPPQTMMERQIPQDIMTVQNPTTPPHRPPPQAIMERQSPQEMMTVQNPTTPPHRPPPQTITERQRMQPEQKEQVDAQSNSQHSITKETQEQGAESSTDAKDTNPSTVEIIPQRAEDADKPRFGGLKNLFDFDMFHHGKDKGKQEKPTIINYYYNTGGSHYPPVYNGGYAQPQPTPTYYQGPAYSSKYKPSGSLYGGGGYGSNAYGSYGSGYRAAVGDEEIAVMLQQQQRMPKITMPNVDDPLTAFNTTATETDNADTIKQNLNKRFAINDHNYNNNSPAAYLVVVRNNNNSKKSRSKRSTEEFTTLEPIDENSLNALRKTYKNSLKEITLNPNETPAEALMRYKAQSIREALEKANQVPMEITTDVEHYEGVKDSKEAKPQQQDYNQPMPSTSYVFNANEEFKAIHDKRPQSYMDNDLYTAVPVSVTIPQNQPLAMTYNQQPEIVHESPQEGLYNNYVVKYNSPAAYDSYPKVLPQNRHLRMHNSLDSVPYVDEYSVDNQAYQMANPDDINAHSFVYPQVNAKQLNTVQTYAIEAPNAITKEIQNYYPPTGHIIDYAGPKASEFSNYPAQFNTKKNPYLFTNAVSKDQILSPYSRLRPSEVEHRKSFNTVRTQEKLSFENLISVIKERITQCCNECKNKILKSLDESLSAYSLPVPEPYHTLTYRNPEVEENFKYKHWLMEMGEKGYDKNYLTNRHQEEYLKDGRLDLHITPEDGYGQGKDNIFFKNNQSYKRETTEPNMEKEAKTEVVIATIKTDNSLEKQTNEAGDDEKDQEEEEEMVVEELQPDEKEKEEKINTKPLKLEKSIDKLKEIDIKGNENSKNNTKPIGTAESTTHSVYAMRGQFRPEKQRPKPFSMAETKHFDNYKHIDKIGRTNALVKTEESNQKKRTAKSDELQKILILLPKENIEEKENIQQVTTTKSNVILKATSNETNAANKSKQLTSRNLQTSSQNRMSTQNSSESNSSAESIG